MTWKSLYRYVWTKPLSEIMTEAEYLRNRKFLKVRSQQFRGDADFATGPSRPEEPQEKERPSNTGRPRRESAGQPGHLELRRSERVRQRTRDDNGPDPAPAGGNQPHDRRVQRQKLQRGPVPARTIKPGQHDHQHGRHFTPPELSRGQHDHVGGSDLLLCGDNLVDRLLHPPVRLVPKGGQGAAKQEQLGQHESSHSALPFERGGGCSGVGGRPGQQIWENKRLWKLG